MNWVDLVIVLLVAVFALDGIKRGFLLQTFNIIGFLFSLLASLTFYAPLADLLIKIMNIPKIGANPAAFLLLWIITESIFFGVFTGLYSKFIKQFHPHKINKYLGAIPAAVNAILFLAFVLLLTVSLPINPKIKQDIFNSKAASPLIDKATALEKPFNSIFGPITKQTLTFLTVKPEDKSSIDLKFTQKNVSVDIDSEKQMFELVNQERAKVGVKTLVWSENLAKVGRQHSKDMFERGYFSHYSPEGADVGDRLEKNGINFSYAGENLALAPNVIRAHAGLMSSEGHRRNILDPAFTKIGIGIVDGGVYGEMTTQVFTQ